MKCLLCGSGNVDDSEVYRKEDLAALWTDLYPDVNEELNADAVIRYKCKDCSLNFFDPKLAGDDKFYSALGELDWYYLHPGKTEYDYVQKYMKDGNYVLDVGSGRGVLYTKTKAAINYTGLELSTKAVALAREANINVLQEYVQDHAQKNAGKYDLVCLFQVLEHLTEIDSFIKAIYETLKKNGLFTIAVPNNDGFVSFTPNYTFNLPPHHTILWTESSLRYMAKKYNFEVVDVEKEKLQDIHRDAAYRAYIVKLFKKIVFKPTKLIDRSVSNWRINRVTDLLLKVAPFRWILIGLAKRKVKDGQSIIITLRKK